MTTVKETPNVDDDLDFELIIGDAGGQIDNGDVPIRWCMKPDFVAQLKERNIVDPHVLITSAYPNSHKEYIKEMDRKLVPLSELMTYLRFTKAGKCRVVGVLLDGSEGRKLLWERYMRKSGGTYEKIVSDYDGTIYDNIRYEVAITSDHVEIPTNVFGREPSPWVKWYVNLWHNSHDKISDECDFRKRLLIGIIFKWEIFIPFIIGLVSFRSFWAGGVMMCGYFKKVRFWRVFRPYKYPSVTYNVLDDVHSVNDNLLIMTRPDFTGKEGMTTKMLSGLAFAPIVWLSVAIIIFLGVHPDGIGGFLRIEAAAIAVVLGVLITFDLFVMVVELLIRFDIGGKFIEGFIAIMDKLADMLPSGRISQEKKKLLILSLFGLIGLVVVVVAFKFLLAFLGILIVSMGMMFGFMFVTLVFANQILDWLDNYFAMSAKDNNYDQIGELLCPKDEDNLRPNYKYIPKKQRTIRLWYHDFKNKVCKPMQS